ncbi:MAG: excalibur calcium-binding domain-containing protein [Sphingomonadales bacterium]|nr:excalibur calcium-binding domain-containing protein [Sphingomonadales bacterium]
MAARPWAADGTLPAWQLSPVTAYAHQFAVSRGFARQHEPQPGDYWPGCDAARAAGVAPLYLGEPGYRPQMDGDNDGSPASPIAGGRARKLISQERFREAIPVFQDCARISVERPCERCNPLGIRQLADQEEPLPPTSLGLCRPFQSRNRATWPNLSDQS